MRLRAYCSRSRTACGLLALSLIAMLCPVYSSAQANSEGPPEHTPFKIFDNLYYVGINFATAYLTELMVNVEKKLQVELERAVR